jgi:hypothetical protein
MVPRIATNPSAGCEDRDPDAQRRELPWVRLGMEYSFEIEDGTKTPTAP